MANCEVCGSAPKQTNRKPNDDNVSIISSDSHGATHYSSLYTCPKCFIKYCSKNCYVNHSSDCVQKFTSEKTKEVLEAMQYESIDQKGEEALKTLKSIKNFQDRIIEEEEQEQEDVQDQKEEHQLMEILAKLERLGNNMDQKQINELLSMFSEDQKREFHMNISSGRLLYSFQPWWIKDEPKIEDSVVIPTCKNEESTNIEAVEDTNDGVEERTVDLYPIRTKMKAPQNPPPPAMSLQQLIHKKKPSPQLPFHLVTIIYSYCATQRCYNGDCHEENLLQEACACLLSLSPCLLDPNLRLNSLEQAIDHTLSIALSNSPVIPSNSPEFWLEIILRDVCLILESPEYVEKCLFDCELVVEECIAQQKKDSTNFASKNSQNKKPKRWYPSKTILQCLRKLQFFLVWVQEGMIMDLPGNQEITRIQGKNEQENVMIASADIKTILASLRLQIDAKLQKETTILQQRSTKPPDTLSTAKIEIIQ